MAATETKKPKDGSLWRNPANGIVYRYDANASTYKGCRPSGGLSIIQWDDNETIATLEPHVDPGEGVMIAAAEDRASREPDKSDLKKLLERAEQYGDFLPKRAGNWQNWLLLTLAEAGCAIERNAQNEIKSFSGNWQAFDAINDEIKLAVEKHDALYSPPPEEGMWREYRAEYDAICEFGKRKGLNDFDLFTHWGASNPTPCNANFTKERIAAFKAQIERVIAQRNSATTQQQEPVATKEETIDPRAELAAAIGEENIEWFLTQNEDYCEFLLSIDLEDRLAQIKIDRADAIAAESTTPSSETVNVETVQPTTTESVSSAEEAAASIQAAAETAETAQQPATVTDEERLDAILSRADASWLDRSIVLRILRKLTDRGGLMADIMDELESSTEFCIANPKKASTYLEGQYGIVQRTEEKTTVTKTEDGVIVSEDGEVLNPLTAFEALGIVQKRQDFAITTEEEARWFIGKIRQIQLGTSDRVYQLMALIQREMNAYKALMDYFGPQLRTFVEPQLPRVTRGENKGKLKAKNWKCLEGTVFFKSTGGWSVADRTRTKEFIDAQIVHYGPDKNDYVRLGDINQLIPEHLREKFGIKLSVSYSKTKLYAAAKAGEYVPGVEEAPEHELGIMGIGGGGDRSAWSLKRAIDGLKQQMKSIEQRIRGLAYGIDDESEDEDAA